MAPSSLYVVSHMKFTGFAEEYSLPKHKTEYGKQNVISGMLVL